MEAKADKEDLLSDLDQTDLSPEDLYLAVTVSRAIRHTYLQFAGQEANEKIVNMFDDHGLILKEEESEDDSN